MGRTKTSKHGHRVRRLCAGALCAAWFGCTPNLPNAVTSEQASKTRVFVDDTVAITHTDDDCLLHYDAFEQSLPRAVRGELVKAGFTVVTDPRAPHDLEARIFGHFTYCKESGSCINGSADVNLHHYGELIEHYRFDTGDDECTSSPTVDEFPDRAVEDMSDYLLASERIASITPQAASTPQPGPPGYQYPYPYPYPQTAPQVASGPMQAQPGAAPPARPPSARAAQHPPPSADAFALGSPQPSAYALIIGIEKYRDAPAPTGARRDAKRFATLAQRTLGIPRENVRLLVDERATRSDIMKQLAWLEANVPVSGRVYFFYSGHGAPEATNGTPYLLPYDGDPSALEYTAIALSTLQERLSRTKASDTIAFLDACFSGAGGRSVLPPGARPLVRVKQAPVQGRISILASSSGSQISGPSPDGSGGLFTNYLIQGLGQGRSDLDGDRQISLAELESWIGPRVTREALRANRKQTPSLSVASDRQAEKIIVAFGVRPN